MDEFELSSYYSNVWLLQGSNSNNLKQISYCGCPGYTLSYECIVMGSDYFGVTVWSGSAFDGAGGEIILSHNLYNSTESHVRAYGDLECNKGSIVAQGIRIENGTYTSWLTISVSTDMSIECFYDATNSESILGQTKLICCCSDFLNK